MGRAVRHRGQAEATGFGSCFQSNGWIGDGGGQDGAGGRKALGWPQRAAKGEPGSCRGQEGWEDAHGCATWWGAGGDAGEAPQPPRNTALVQGLRDQLLESSNSLLSPGDFCTVFSELLFQAGQEVGCFPRNSLAPPGRHVWGRCHPPAGRAGSGAGAQPWHWQGAA